MGALTEREIEIAAMNVLSSRDSLSVPIDPFEIAREEGIYLLEGDYDACFDGRIECRKVKGRTSFYLLYPGVQMPWRTPGRVRFSVAHELGHFYLPNHRRYLLSGYAHGSKTDFMSNKQMEREADWFASAILMPMDQFHLRVERKRDGVCTLGDLLQISDFFFTSVTSTVLRYIDINYEPCGVVIAKNDEITYSRFSEDMRSCGMGYVEWRRRLPSTSIVGRMQASLRSNRAAANKKSGSVDAGVWFDARRGVRLWEDAMVLGKGGLVLSFLAIQSDDREDED